MKYFLNILVMNLNIFLSRFRVAFVNSDFEGLIAAVRQRRNISQTQKWASVSLGAVGTTQPRKQRAARLKDQFHSLETALQRKDERNLLKNYIFYFI
jgi:hypothetical protein